MNWGFGEEVQDHRFFFGIRLWFLDWLLYMFDVEDVEDVGGFCDGMGADFDEIIRSFRRWRVDRSWDGEDFTVLFERATRRDERSGFFCGFDNEGSVAEAGDYAVAVREVVLESRSAKRELAQDGAAAFDDFLR